MVVYTLNYDFMNTHKVVYRTMSKLQLIAK